MALEPVAREDLVALLVPLIQQFLVSYQEAQVVEMIQLRHVPTQFLDLAFPYIFEHPELVRVDQPEFVEAMARSLPRHAALIRGPVGRAWCLAAGDAIGPQLPLKAAGYALRSLFGGRR